MIRLDAAESEILLKASREQVAGVESQVDEVSVRLNAAEHKIELKADYIDLQGYVTADELATEIADISSAFAESISTEYLVASTYATFNCPIRYQGSPVGRSPLTVVTSFTQASGETAQTTDMTILNTALGEQIAHMPNAGTVTTF